MCDLALHPLMNDSMVWLGPLTNIHTISNLHTSTIPLFDNADGGICSKVEMSKNDTLFISTTFTLCLKHEFALGGGSGDTRLAFPAPSHANSK